MTPPGTESNPLRVAIIGSGPAGFYTADHLLKQEDFAVEVDMYDRLPTPFGLVRHGVAPDHQKIKSVTRAYDRIATRPNFHFFGNVEFGTDVTLDDLREYYHQIVFATGAQTDRYLNIPGIDLEGSHPATEFVAWYNGHPDYRDLDYDFSHERAAVIGVGNVAVDVARILSRTIDELKKTDIADYALEALSKSRIREVYLVGRRGPAQAAFTTPEVKELGEMEDAAAITLPEEMKLDKLSREELERSQDRSLNKKVEILQSFAGQEDPEKSRKLYLRFLVSPVELTGDETGRVASMRMVRNELYATEAGTLRPRPTDEFEELEVGLVFRSIGYRGVPLPDVPFNENWGVILNREGRVLDPDNQEPVTGLYTSGWIKRGPTGVIGTNKPDAGETVECMIEDLEAGKTLDPDHPNIESVQALVRQRQPHFFTYEDWKHIDQLEMARGKEEGRPRVKFTTTEEMLTALEREVS